MKKVFSLILIALLLFTGVVPTYAESKEESELLEQNIKNVSSYAVSFIKAFTTCSDYASGDVITIQNEDEEVSGFCVDLINNNETCGYVIIKFVDNAPVISEFCIEEGAPNPYVALITNYGITGNLLKFYSIGANDYQIYDESSKTAYGFYDKKLSTKEFESCKALAQSLKGDPDEQFLNYSGLDGWSVVSDTYEGTVNSSKTITGAGSISYYCSSTVSSNNLTYACSIVALS